MFVYEAFTKGNCKGFDLILSKQVNADSEAENDLRAPAASKEVKKERGRDYVWLTDNGNQPCEFGDQKKLYVMKKRPELDPDTLPGRISQRLVEVRISARGASVLAGLSDTFVKNILIGLSHTPRQDTLARLAMALKTTPEWLLYGDTKEPPAAGIEPPQHNPHDLRMMGTSLNENGDLFLNGHVADYIKRPHALQHRQRIFGLYVASSAMEPAYYDGDPIIVDPDRPPTAGDDVLIELKPAAVGIPGVCYLRTLVKRNPTSLIVKQHNPRDELKLAVKDVANVYRVVNRRELLGV